MSPWIKRAVFVAVPLLVALVALILGTIGTRPFIGPDARPLTDRRFEPTRARLERGRYLATSVSGCLGCHSDVDWQAPGYPPKAGTEGSGRTWGEEGLPFLTSPNLTPDPETGAGTWTDDMLARAIREGISHEGRALFPMMPYQQFRYMSDEDLASVVVYIRSLAPIRRELPPTRLPFPMNRFINLVPEPIERPVPAPSKDPVTYGGYLVRLGACRDCHTPSDENGNPVPGMEFAGGFPLEGPYPEQVASANITPDPSGIPYYSDDVFLGMMRTGMVGARKIHDAMPWLFYGKQTDADLKAMFAYLKTVKPVAHRVDNTLPPTPCPRCNLTHGGGSLNVPANQER